MAQTTVVQALGRRSAEQLTGMTLEEAFVERDRWVGQLRTPPGSVAGWHHHEDHDPFTYLVAGKARFEWAGERMEASDLEPGDFVHITPHIVHRESNPGVTANLLVIFRTGTGPLVSQVDSPEGTGTQGATRA